jgi:hypothetical protein
MWDSYLYHYKEEYKMYILRRVQIVDIVRVQNLPVMKNINCSLSGNLSKEEKFTNCTFRDSKQEISVPGEELYNFNKKKEFAIYVVKKRNIGNVYFS